MATYTWNGTTGTWDVSSNWSPAGPPPATGTAGFGGTGYTVTIAGSPAATAANVIINPSAGGSINIVDKGAFNVGTVNINAGGTFTVDYADANIGGLGTSGVPLFVVDSGGILNDLADPGTEFSGYLTNAAVDLNGGTLEVSMNPGAYYDTDVLFGSGDVDVSGLTGASATNLGTVNKGGDTLTYVIGGETIQIADVNLTSYTLNYLGNGVVQIGVVAAPPPCFAAGTRITTAIGPVDVQDLQVGARVIVQTPSGDAEREVLCVGNRVVNIQAHPQPELVAPVTVQAGAFADGVPARDLVLSPDHALFVDGKLIRVRQLVNGTSITQNLAAKSAHYFHVELSEHSVLYAEGLPAESYLDTGNRAAFANGGGATQMHPEFGPDELHEAWARACAPLATDEATIRPVWDRLSDRAAARGRQAALPEATTDAGLHLIAGKRKVRPAHIDGNRYVFAVPAGLGAVRLVSRAAAPAETQPWLDDRRPLGVAVRRIIQRGDAATFTMDADHPGLGDGWYAAERGVAAWFRWTDGDARIPVRPGAQIIEIELHATGAYPASMTAARKVA